MPISRYAETHYKFRLPWSPLHRPLPEMVVDAPWAALPGHPVPLVLAVHDAHRFPVRLREVRVAVRAGGELHRERREFDLALDRPFHWIDLPFPGPETPGQNLVDTVFSVEDAKGRRHDFLNHSLPFLPPQSLDILRMASPFPFPEGWTSGDLHCHTTWSEDPVEWGGDPVVMNRAAACMGMGFWASTDHSYDFAWEHPDWMRPTDPLAKFARYREAIESASADGPIILPSEEVSCGNRDGRNVHLIVVDHPEYIPGQGDGGRRWFDNKPDLSLAQVLERIRPGGAPAIAAHPRPGIGMLQKFVFRRGDYDHADLHEGISGLQFWNGGRGDDFRQGRALWVQDLLRGSRRRPVAGNDAHGDLNRATQVGTPLFSLRQTRSHRFGHARTWLHLDEPPSRAALRRALAGDTPTTISNGPWLDLRVPGAAHPVRRSSRSDIELHALSGEGFGPVARIRLYGQRRGDPRETLLSDRTLRELDFHDRIEMPKDLVYARAELETANGFAALTEAIEPG
jgi:hypothetical protein